MGEPARPQIISDGRSSLGLHGVLMSARACSLRNAPGLRYPDFRTLVVLCRMLGVELLRSDKRKRGAARHPDREVCAADRERPQPAALHQPSAPQSATDRRPARVSDIRCTSERVRIVDLPHARSAKQSKTRAEPASTLPPWCLDLRIRPPRKLPTCHPRGLFCVDIPAGPYRPGGVVERIMCWSNGFRRPISRGVPHCVCHSPRRVRHRCEYRCANP